jgi:hypothetical protein
VKIALLEKFYILIFMAAVGFRLGVLVSTAFMLPVSGVGFLGIGKFEDEVKCCPGIPYFCRRKPKPFILLKKPEPLPLEPGDFYFNEQGFMVFTEQYHRRRGYCCKSGCRHCPYGFTKKQGPEKKS